jgi:hypothetical protein
MPAVTSTFRPVAKGPNPLILQTMLVAAIHSVASHADAPARQDLGF